MKAASLYRSNLVGAVLWVALPHLSYAAVDRKSPALGVIVEGLSEPSTLIEAGVRLGDVLFSWELVRDGQEEIDGDYGSLETPFDWSWLEIEQAPRGSIRLNGERDSVPKVWVVEMGLWNADVRPRFNKNLREQYILGRQQVDIGRSEAGIAYWHQLTEMPEISGRPFLQSWIWMRAGELLVGDRNFEASQAMFQKALVHASDPLLEVVVLDAVGAFLGRNNEIEQARDALLSALEIRRRTWGETLGVAKGQQELGVLAWRRGDLGTAETYFRQSLVLREKLSPESLEVASSLNSLGNVAALRGYPKEAEEFYHRSLILRERLAPESLDVAHSLNNLGNIALRRGDLVASEAYHERALEIRKVLAPSGIHMAHSLNNLGAIKQEYGDLAGAQAAFQDALRIWVEIEPRSLNHASSTNNLGVVALLRGDLTAAWSHYQDALEIRDRIAPNSLDLATSYSNLGTVARRRGDLFAAESYHRRALELRESLAPGGLEVAASFTNLGLVVRKRGDLTAAEAYLHGALAIWNKRAPGSLNMAVCLNNLGAVAFARGDLAAASDFQQRALALRESLAPNSLETAISFGHLGRTAKVGGDLLVANTYYKSALGIWEKLAPNSAGEAWTLYSIGDLFRKSGNKPEAMEFLDRAIEALEGQARKLGGSTDLQGSFRAQNREIYRGAIEVLLMLGGHDKAFHYWELYRARSFLQLLAERDLLFSADISVELDRKRRSLAYRHDRILRRMAENPEALEELSVDLEHLVLEREEVIAAIRGEAPSLSRLKYPKSLTLIETQTILDSGTVMLSYSVGAEQTDLFVVSREDFYVRSLTVGEVELRLMVRTFLEDIGRSKSTRSEFFKGLQGSARHLYEILIGPVADVLEFSDRLLILPDGPLHELPFGALIRPMDNEASEPESDWQYLVEWKPLHLALSGTVYAEVKAARRAPSVAFSPLVALFGDPFYGEALSATSDPIGIADMRVRAVVKSSSFDWKPLAYTRQEVLRIASLHKNVQTYLGKGATEEQLEFMSRDVNIIHFAVHGFLDDRFPLDSALVLTLPEGFPEDRDNGLLQAWEILESVRLDADLVVLSACQSALGEEQGGEGLVGLTRAFQYAGARTVAATLWSVGDRATSELMVRFYRHLNSGKPKDQALRAAQIDLLRGSIEFRSEGEAEVADYSVPYFWAAFQLYGDWQ